MSNPNSYENVFVPEPEEVGDLLYYAERIKKYLGILRITQIESEAEEDLNLMLTCVKEIQFATDRLHEKVGEYTTQL